MRTIAIVAVLLAAAPVVAKPWQGVEPGQTKKELLIQKFGEPSRTVTTEGKEIIAYFDQKAIKGTKQVQFKVDPGTQLVERIDVFPGPVIDKESVESTYGNACPAGKAPAGPCYQKKLTDDFRTYMLYAKLGLAVFLNEDGKTVHSFIFTPQPAGK
ncbi:hypothetical protein KYC5002_18535 [Archangium violaceum]|uniref:hypothetical protein n=1 Tax=Archangium TaxID=47 RepID=UPI000936BA3B|nr:hypothetical protein [Archangium sp. Cb G35]OJT19914.1 hypothetical protein BO221_32425 [Archangium sp. Cb G35]WPB81115.1 hypothetical protein KYC5002_18535 [Archangium gephyra]